MSLAKFLVVRIRDIFKNLHGDDFHVRYMFPLSHKLLAQCAEDKIIIRELEMFDSHQPLPCHATMQVIAGTPTCANRVSDELHYLKYLGASCPRHFHLLIAGAKLSREALNEAWMVIIGLN